MLFVHIVVGFAKYIFYI